MMLVSFVSAVCSSDCGEEADVCSSILWEAVSMMDWYLSLVESFVTSTIGETPFGIPDASVASADELQ